MGKQFLPGEDTNITVKAYLMCTTPQRAESKVYLHANNSAEKAQMMLADCFQLSDPKQGVLVALILVLLSQQRKPAIACFNSLCLCLAFEVMRTLKCIPARGSSEPKNIHAVK